VGGSMVESEGRGAVSVGSALELLNAAYALHPAFGEAEIVELGAALRPAFPDNLPHVRRDGRVLRANGLYRHGFLLAPALASQVADTIFNSKLETDHSDLPQRRRARSRARQSGRFPAVPWVWRAQGCPPRERPLCRVSRTALS